MKKLVLSMGAVALVISANSAMAGSATGTVTAAGVYLNNLVAITVTGASGQPSCAPTGRFGFNMNDTAAKGMYATIVAAQRSGDTVYVVGTGGCTKWPNREDVLYVEGR